MPEPFEMMIIEVNQEQNRVILFAPGDTEKAETRMVWNYHPDTGRIQDRVGDVFTVRLELIRRGEE